MKNKANEKNFDIADEILESIADNGDYTVRELINIFNRLKTYEDIAGETANIGYI